MFLNIQNMRETKMAGKSMTMSLMQNQTASLWQSFMPQRNQIPNRTDERLYSIEVYDADYFATFDPAREFQKWAAVEVTGFTMLPNGLEPLIIPQGDYAVFLHRGPASEGERTYRYIFEQWLPSSGYTLDQRPHFAIMDERYKANDLSSEEEIWIPVTKQ